MTVKELKQWVEWGNDFYFTYDGVRAGMESTVHKGVWSYNLWWKDVDKTYSEWKEVIHDPVFNGESVATLMAKKQIEIEFF